MSIKVNLDTIPFSSGARTGVYRYIYHLAKGLIETNQCDLSFAFSHISDIFFDKSKTFLNQNPMFSKHDLFQYYEHSEAKHAAALYETTKKQIFHSPFHMHPILQDIKNNSLIKAFTTIHDVIPLIFPEYRNFHRLKYEYLPYHTIDENDWILCPSETTKQDVINYCKVDQNKIFMTYNGVSDKEFYFVTDKKYILNIKNKYHIPDKPYIIYVGAIEVRKNLIHLIESFIKLIEQEKHLDLNLVICGMVRGEYLPVIKKFQEIAGSSLFSHRIIHLNDVSDEDLPSLYSGALAFTCLSHYEGFGIPIIEAMQCQTPTIVSNIPAFQEVVQNTEILVPTDDPDAFSQAVLNIYSSTSYRDKLIKHGLKRAKVFSWESVIQKTLAAYKRALSE